ncbi:MAG: hypothetical protein KDD47_22175 [Acidobacteria bacterium]|nr:hypothetical protein [Acidobacteriota bacterium]
MTQRQEDTGQTAAVEWTPKEMEESYLKLLRGLKAGAADNPAQLGVVRRIAAWIDSEEVLRFIAAEPGWFQNWELKEALLRNPATPVELKSIPDRQIAIFDLLRELDQSGLTEEERQEIQEDARSLITSLPAAEREEVKKRAYELSTSRREKKEAPAPAPQAPPPAGEPRAEAPEAEEPSLPEPVFEEIDTSELAELLGSELWQNLFAPLDEEEAPAEASDPVAAEPEPAAEPEETVESIPWEEPSQEAATLEEKAPEAKAPAPSTEDAEIKVARSTTDPELLRRLSQSTREEVHLALLENPAATEAQILPLARRAGSRLASALYHNRRWFHRPSIRQALLDNPNAPALAQLATVSTVTDLNLLLGVLASSKIRHLEVKSKARERIRTVFRTFSVGEKVAAVRRYGRRLLSHLWTDFFRDEALVLRCLEERQLDEGTVLEIARSRVAPRRALERIGTTPAWTANYSIVLALVLNPKTPRQVAQRLLAKLTPADRKRVKGSLSVAESVRRMA